MKSFKISFVFLVVAQLSVALFVPESNGLVARQGNRFGGNRNGQNGGGNNNQNGGNNNQNGGNNNQNGGNNNQGGGNNNQTGGNNNQNGGNNNQNGGNNGGNGANADPQTSLTLDPSIIQQINGGGQADGEADSVVSTNNFIGFCVGKTITNGKQVQGGSCNPTPMGDIPSVDNMPSCKFEFPPNGGNVEPDTAFTIIMNTQGMQTGTFTNAANTYYAAPQQLNGGQIIGHNHVVVEEIASLDSTQPTNPRVFAFFKGLNAPAANGKLTADLPKGLPAGTYRLSSISSAANHQSVVMPVAQRGAVDDAVYFTVGGNANNGNGGQNGGNGGQNGGNQGGNGGQNGGQNGANGGQNNNGQNGAGNQNRGNRGRGRNGGRNGRRYERRFFTWH